jgi:hypothetical protein
MITIPVSVDIAGGTAPYIFTFNSTNPNVTFGNATGTATLEGSHYNASTDVLYVNQTDINTTIISCTFIDANGCSTTLNPVVVSNPCTMQSTITNNGEFVFVATTTGGSGSYSYEWNYDNLLFELNADTDSSDNQLSLMLKKVASPPTSTVVSMYVTDSNGCVLQKSYTYNFCYPTIANPRIGLRCSSDAVTNCSRTGTTSNLINYDLKPLVSLCANQTIDWSKTTFTVPIEYCVVHKGNGIIDIASTKTIGFTALIVFKVVTTSGLQAQGTLTVNTPVCANRPFFNGVSQTIQLTIEDVVSDEKLLNVESRVGGTPDWSTFAFVGSPTWGTVTFNGNRDIVYTITNVATTPTVPDTISWTLNDYSGGQINITDTVLRNRIALPVTTTEVICNSCGETTTPQDLLANDTGSIDRSTVQIVLNDPDIVITKDTNNNFIFTSLPGASFSNLNSYKVANIQGAFSPAQNFIVRVACVGNNTNPSLDLTCAVSKVFDIKDQFVGGNSFNDVFVETTPSLPTYASQGGVIVGAEGTVTLTGLVNKVYTFQYTAENQAPCTPAFDDIGILTVNHAATPNINLSAATLVSTGVYSFTFTYSGIASNFTVTDDGLPATFHTGIVANNGSGSFILYAAAGSSIVISATTVCGVVTNDTTVI